MKVTIIYDNESYEENLEPDWRFSALLEIEGTSRILFDTGTKDEILLSNMENLKSTLDP